MKIIKQLVGFILGIAVGACLYSLLKLRPLTPARWANGSSPMGANNKYIRPPWVQRSLLPQVARPRQVHSRKFVHAMAREVAEARPRVQPKPEATKVAEPAATKEGAIESISSAPPALTIFKAMGYVEESGGKLEAIILQENQIQVVHVGDLIAGRYRVKKVSPDTVEALDETLVQSPMAEPNGPKSNELTASAGQRTSTPPGAVAAAPSPGSPAAREGDYVANTPGAESISAAPTVIAQVQSTNPTNPAAEDGSAPPQSEETVAGSLGYVQKADGKVEAVVADGDSIRLVPASPEVIVAQVTAPPPPQAEVAPAPVSSQADVPPAQIYSPPAGAAVAAVPSIGEAMAASAVDPEGSSSLAMASLIRQSSYEFSIPVPGGAHGSTAHSLGMGAARGAAGAMDGTNDQATLRVSANHGTAVPSASSGQALVMAAHGQDARATGPVGSTVRSAKLPVEKKPVGFVVKGNGELAAILSENDEVYIVRQGDRFADRYRAVSVSADAVEAVEEAPGHGQDGHTSSRGTGVLPASSHGQDGHATFIFQTLGYVETQDGQMQAIVADGSQIYLVKQGETFADRYRATSVDPTLVLATRVSPGQKAENSLSAQTESGGKPASKKLYGYLHYPSLGRANARVLHEVDASGSPVLTNLGMNLLNSSLTGFDLQSHFFTADSPNVTF